MAMPVARWMKDDGMTAKSEFVTPWGICDLAGIRFNRKNEAHRLKLKQTRAINSITRAMLLLQIPDVGGSKSITLDRLIRNYASSIPEDVIRKETSRLIADRFVERLPRMRLKRVNGWMPLQDRIVAVELKLGRINEAMRQAVNNLGFADESYIALPADVAHRVASTRSRWSRFLDAGVGVLSVEPRRCEVLLRATRTESWTDKAVQLYCVEKFWSTRPKGK